MLVSSHLMSEMALTADRLIVVGKGRLIAEGTVDDVVQTQLEPPRPRRRRRSAATPAHPGRARARTSAPNPTATLTVTGIDARDVGHRRRHRRHHPLRALAPQRRPWRKRSWSSPATHPSTTPAATSSAPTKEQQHDRHHHHVPCRASSASVEPSYGRVFRAATRAEWTKMRSVRSTMWTLLAHGRAGRRLRCPRRAPPRSTAGTHLDPSEQAHFDSDRPSASAACSSPRSPSACSASW